MEHLLLHLKVPHGVELIGFADDLAALIKVQKVTDSLLASMVERNLELAYDKTEAVLLQLNSTWERWKLLRKKRCATWE